MAQTLETLARRTQSMTGIRSVVHTMKTLSVINAAPYERAARAIEAYHATVLDGLHAFLTATGPLAPEPSRRARHVMVVFGSDHGLCGNYNETLARHVARHLGTDASPEKLLCVGARLQEALSDQGHVSDETFFPPASVDGIGRLANLIAKRLDTLRAETGPGGLSASLAYIAREDVHGQAPRIAPLLPLGAQLLQDLGTKPWQSRSLPGFTMERDDLFLALVRAHLFASIYKASAEALATENAARLALMQQAEQSVDDRLDTLIADTRTVRQAEITTELLDVVIGFEALRKRKNPAATESDETERNNSDHRPERKTP